MVVAFNLPNNLVRALKVVSARRGISMSALAREALEAYLREEAIRLGIQLTLDLEAGPPRNLSQRDQLEELYHQSVLEDYEERLKSFEDMLNRYVAARAMGYGYRGYGGTAAPSWEAVKQTFISLDKFTARLVRDKVITPELLRKFLELKRKYKNARK